MTLSAVVLHPDDTVACLLRDHSKGERATLPAGPSAVLTADTPMGHKIALCALARGARVIKYGGVIGYAKVDIAPGAHVHLHNLEGGLR